MVAWVSGVANVSAAGPRAGRVDLFRPVQDRVADDRIRCGAISVGRITTADVLRHSAAPLVLAAYRRRGRDSRAAGFDQWSVWDRIWQLLVGRQRPVHPGDCVSFLPADHWLRLSRDSSRTPYRNRGRLTRTDVSCALHLWVHGRIKRLPAGLPAPQGNFAAHTLRTNGLDRRDRICFGRVRIDSDG